MMLQLARVDLALGGRPVLAGADIGVARGEVVALLGPSGSGKTTITELAAGLRRPDAGTVERRAARLGTVFQEARLLPWLTAQDNIAYGLAILGTGRAERGVRAAGLLERLGMSPADARKLPSQLSGGMQRRVAIGRALAIDPDLLLLDEPFSALDPELRSSLGGILIEHLDRSAGSALLVTHDPFEALRIADRIALLDKGRIVAEHRPAGRRGRFGAGVLSAYDALRAEPLFDGFLARHL